MVLEDQTSNIWWYYEKLNSIEKCGNLAVQCMTILGSMFLANGFLVFVCLLYLSMFSLLSIVLPVLANKLVHY